MLGFDELLVDVVVVELCGLVTAVVAAATAAAAAATNEDDDKVRDDERNDPDDELLPKPDDSVDSFECFRLLDDELVVFVGTFSGTF